MLISITRLRVRRFWLLPLFVLHTLRSKKQVQHSSGFVTGIFGVQPGLVFWTITAWNDEASMRAFRNGGSHAGSMRYLMEWCDQASYVHWSQEDAALPAAAAAFTRLRDEGKLSKVRRPSVAHIKGHKAGEKEPKLQGRFFPQGSLKLER